MKKLILIKAGRTDWDDQDRLAGDVEINLNETGRADAFAVAGDIGRLSPKSIFCGTDVPATQTAEILGEALGLKVRAVEELREVDLGHWEGLTNDQFRERFPKVYKAWHDDAAAVEPPDGESLAAADARFRTGMQRVLKRKSATPIVLVLGRMAYAHLRCRLADEGHEHFWTYAQEPPQWCELDLKPSNSWLTSELS